MVEENMTSNRDGGNDSDDFMLTTHVILITKPYKLMFDSNSYLLTGFILQ